MLTVGIPKEIKTREKRVGLTPEMVKALRKLGIPVLVQKGAGSESGFSDEDYLRADADLVSDAKELYARADLIQKVKEPLAAEYPLLRRGQILFCFLHLASPAHCDLAKALVRSGVTAIGFETLEANGRMPILAPMSEIAGGLSAVFAGYFSSISLVEDHRIKYPGNFFEELEKVASLYPSIPAALKLKNVLIFGGGVAGQKAMEVAIEMGAAVTVVEKKPDRRKGLEEKKAKVFSSEEPMDLPLEAADVLIGAVHVRGRRALQVVNEDQLSRASKHKKKIMMDVAIDQGGNFPEARPTTYDDPLYLDSWGNLRFAVANIPSLSGRAASEVLSQQSFHYTAALADNPEEAMNELPELARAVNVRGEEILIPAIREAHHL